MKVELRSCLLHDAELQTCELLAIAKFLVSSRSNFYIISIANYYTKLTPHYPYQDRYSVTESDNDSDGHFTITTY